jgi:lactobin A/cerein 7B family class IIb bacteriocin
MKNLENYGVQEMNTQEVKEVEGGIWPIIAVWALGYMIYNEMY